jgi:aspartyl-tRNA(Asn)/glutamyl-tRNA(Gln) amidotransferase subunit A
MTHPSELCATDLLSLYRRKALSPVEAVDDVLQRIATLDPEFNAFRLVDEKAARAQARQSEARWLRGEPLGLVDGVPVAFKDLIDVQGWPTRRASLATPDQPLEQDSPAAARLREHGAVLLGKTNTAEFGWKGLTESALAGVTRNPWDREYTPGGSSGGAVAAAALGLGPLQVATDGGGSIRAPAAAAGVFGFKPSFGRVPGYPPAHTGTVFHVGPVTRTVTDAALLLNVISGWDARDWFSLPHDGRDWRVGLQDGVAGLRIAYSRTLGYLQVDPEVAGLVDNAVARFAELGAIVEDTDPGFENPAPIHQVMWTVGAAKLLRGIALERHELIETGLREAAQRGAAITTAQYLDALDRRMELGIHQRRFHQRYDILLTPVLSAPVPKVGTAPSAPFCSPFNLTQQPAASVPCGFTASGLPVGLQIVGPAHRDDLVLRAARAFEAAQPWPVLAKCAG